MAFGTKVESPSKTFFNQVIQYGSFFEVPATQYKKDMQPIAQESSQNINLKIPRTMFCLYTFQIFKKSIFANLKIPRTVFCSYPFQIFKKAYLRI